jgi:hypothetical protein
MSFFKILIIGLFISINLEAKEKVILVKPEINELKNQIIGVKYWSLNNLTNKDFILNKRDKILFRKWINNKPTLLNFVTNVSDQFAVRTFATFHNTICLDMLNSDKKLITKNNKKRYNKNIATCMILSPYFPREYKIKALKYSNFSYQFKITPTIFIINEKIGFILFEIFPNKYKSYKELTKKEKEMLSSIKDVFRETTKRTGILPKNLIALGHFGVSKFTLAKILGKDFDILIDKSTFIEKDKESNEYKQRNTEHIITLKNNNLIKNEIVDYQVAFLKKEYKTKSKKKNMELFYNKINTTFPLKFFVKLKKDN